MICFTVIKQSPEFQVIEPMPSVPADKRIEPRVIHKAIEIHCTIDEFVHLIVIYGIVPQVLTVFFLENINELLW